jgi:ABC-type lipoprotein export system ATPase subunit
VRIQVRDLEQTYVAPHLETRTVIRIDAWDVAPGSRWLLHGVSGSGKTTLLNIISGLLPPTQGEVRLDGQSIYAESESERDRRRAGSIGYVYQVHLLVPILSALENVELPLIYASDLSAVERRDRARSFLAHVGLDGFEKHRPVQLSVGQRLRVAVARALATRPRLVLADEPTAALDPGGAASVVELLLRYSEEQDATLLVASHDPALDASFEHRLTLAEGRLEPLAPIERVT